jgi:hypothetical protein
VKPLFVIKANFLKSDDDDDASMGDGCGACSVVVSTKAKTLFFDSL